MKMKKTAVLWCCWWFYSAAASICMKKIRCGHLFQQNGKRIYIASIRQNNGVLETFMHFYQCLVCTTEDIGENVS